MALSGAASPVFHIAEGKRGGERGGESREKRISNHNREKKGTTIEIYIRQKIPLLGMMLKVFHL